MANTYTQIHIQFIIVVKNRASLIKPEWEVDLYKYISGIIRSYDHKCLAINGVSNHLHVLVGLRPKQSILDLMRIVKTNSSKWINEQKLTNSKFEWQVG